MTIRFIQSLLLLAVVAIVATGCSRTHSRGHVGTIDAPNISDHRLIVPPGLKPGDTIAVIAPAKWRAEEPTHWTVEYLEDLGYNVRLAENVFHRYGYLAGTDQVRAASLMEAFLDPEVDAIFPVTGGYGSTRILDMLDYDAIRANPKMFVGFSDITALHLAILQHSGIITYSTPSITYMLGREDHSPRAFQIDHFWRLVGEESYRQPDGSFARPESFFDMDRATEPVETIVGGTARGRLTGGNLSLIAAMTGTPHQIRTEGTILFLEDVGEAPYRIDRMLMQLQSAGLLDDVAGVVLGLWRNCETDNPDDSFLLREVFDQYFAHRNYPVIYQFPVGHVIENASLPLGIMAELDADAGTLRILEDPIAFPESE